MTSGPRTELNGDTTINQKWEDHLPKQQILGEMEFKSNR